MRVLTHVRTFGHHFNPISLYYCFEPGGERVEKVLAEVTNTPWGERRNYLLDGLSATVEKDFWPLLRYPFMTLRVVAGIYAHAVRLALRGAPYHPHPKR